MTSKKSQFSVGITPMFSVVIPAHNEEKIIGKAIDSLFKQTYQDFEIIVVNDGSTDGTRRVVEGMMKKDKRIRLINFDQGHSAAFARNRGAEQARGKILLFLDADTFINDEFLEEVHKNRTRADAFITLNYPVRDNFMSRTLSRFIGPPKKARLKDGSIYTKENKDEAGAMFFCLTKEAYDKVNGYSESIFYFEDEDFSNKFWESGFKAVLVKRANQYFELPSTFSEFVRQCKWIGKGADSMKDDRMRVLKKLIWFGKSLFLLSPLFFIWRLDYFLIALAVTLGVSYLSILIRSREIFGSFITVPFLYIKTFLVTLNIIKFWNASPRQK